MPGEDYSIKRLDNHLWTITVPEKEIQEKKKVGPLSEIRIQTSQSDDPETQYRFIQIAGKFFKHNEITHKSELESCQFIVTQNNSLNGRFSIVIPDRTVIDQLKQWIPFFSEIRRKDIVTVHLKKNFETSFSSSDQKIFEISKPLKPLIFKEPFDPNEWRVSSREIIIYRIKQEPFEDPFSKLAKQSFQSIEPFVSEAIIQGNLRYKIFKGDLILCSKTVSPQEEEIAENQEVIQAYLEFALTEYGEEYVTHLQLAYGFNFKAMIEKGEPLLPDNIYKVNIGVHNVRIDNLENLFKRLKTAKEKLDSLKLKKSNETKLTETTEKDRAEELWGPNSEFSWLSLLTIREIRGLSRELEKNVLLFSIKNCEEALKNLLGDDPPKEIRELLPDQFNKIAQLIWPDPKYFDNIFTGRKILHLAPCGYKTMGDKKTHDPCRDLFELLHIYPQIEGMKKWSHWLEILSHVAVKKNLIDPFPNDKGTVDWKPGRLIPGPSDLKGNRRWFCVTAVYDNNDGLFYYILEPACKNYLENKSPLPLIYLIRSTASDKESYDFDGDKSLSNKSGLDRYSMPILKKASLPLWIGYCLFAEHLKSNPQDALEKYLDAFKEYSKDIELGLIKKPEDSGTFSEIEKFTKTNDEEEISKQILKIKSFLEAAAKEEKERLEDKISQDIIFAGHSLGAEEAQEEFERFLVGKRRIVCPGKKLWCYALNAPGINSDETVKFIRFGRAHAKLFHVLNLKINLEIRFEKHDVVAESGEEHLPGKEYDPEKDTWLNVKISVFEPLQESKALEITTLETHARRIKNTEKGKDYKIEKISAKELNQFDHAYFLRGRLRQIFGLTSAKVVEIARRFFGFFNFPLISAYNLIKEIVHPSFGKEQRDENGIFFSKI